MEPRTHRRNFLLGSAVGVTSLLLPEASAATSSVTTSTTAPASPESVVLTVAELPDENGYYAVDVSWVAPADDGGSPVTYFEHEVYSFALDLAIATGSQTVAATSTTYLLMDPGDYEFRVAARNAVGLGDPATRAFSVVASISPPPPN